MSKVSILTAVYNAEHYICQCLDSLLVQTFSDFEVICVDDASTDSSLGILKHYEREDNRIHVIHLEDNHGPGHARNVGLSLAKGTIIGFLDSDDWLSENALESVVCQFEKQKQADCVLLHVIKYWDDQHQTPYPMVDFESMSGVEAFRKSLTWIIPGIYFIRAEIHHHIPYDETSHSYSDDNTTRMHFFASREVWLCEGIYYYRQHGESVTHRNDIHRFDYLDANVSMKKWLTQQSVSEDILNLYENSRWLNLIDVYKFYFKARRQLSFVEASYGLSQIHIVWQGIEIRRLNCKTKYKFGYMPFHFSWAMFRLQEELYFFLKVLLKRF